MIKKYVSEIIVPVQYTNKLRLILQTYMQFDFNVTCTKNEIKRDFLVMGIYT